jgi:sec-independent protein translocase protein TatA
MPELLLILAVILVLFGASRLPQLGQGLGEGLRSFKKAFKEGKEEEESAALPPRTQTPEQSAQTGASRTHAKS